MPSLSAITEALLTVIVITPVAEFHLICQIVGNKFHRVKPFVLIALPYLPINDILRNAKLLHRGFDLTYEKHKSANWLKSREAIGRVSGLR
jgi:hypothetical protein